MNALEIVLAVVISAAAVVQIIILVMLYSSVAKFLKRAGKVMDQIEPEIKDVAAGVRGIRIAAENSAREVSEMIATVRITTD